MSSTKVTTPQEKTFSTYNQAQGERYASSRPEYHASLFKIILDHHKATGGECNKLLDLGCGPGTATHGLASAFTHVLGIDPSDGMIATARSHNSTANVEFAVSTAEDLGSNLSPPVEDNSIDLITAANAAHWFDMENFWPSAARVLKPGGTIAFWTPGRAGPHPSTPNAEKIQAAMDSMEEEYLSPFYEPGNIMVRGRYADMLLPWMIDQPVEAFEKESFFRKDWEVDEPFFVVTPEVNMDQLEKMIAVGSPVTRWRLANPDAVGTEEDIVRMLRRRTEELLHEVGVEKGKEVIRAASRGALLMIKKRAVSA
ncbi:hypothetical protein N7493_007522 [Penicillium malachiteum]|uniref:Methyltransferase type 11 domain-containing protein n=1 Tax=Penicillium malachiteum TaxID=1324776 RepID=A0AAD6MU28_9EURO|nr:hypothetical protein N7493_007522 [Penicillium malachiteum]